LADEPVSVWREPFPVRARRWVKRHRTKVVAGLATVGVGVAALAVGLVLVAEKNRKLEAAHRDLTDSNAHLEVAHANLQESKAKAEENLKHARAAAREMTKQALGDTIRRHPGMLPVQQAPLKNALQYYRTVIAAQRPDDPEVQEELAFAHYVV